MWPFSSRARPAAPSATPLYLYNTMGKEKQVFSLPPFVRTVRMYNCGPTVYGRQHIGNLSMFVFADVLRRTLEYNGFAVKQVINFTDFGHLSGDNVGDADEGEDRMTKGLKREGMAVTMENMHTLARKYAELFLEDIRSLNIDTERITFPYASDYIPAQIAMILALEEKGYAYRGKHGVYFDTSRYSDYGKLGNIDLAGLREGARVLATDEKKNPTDFLLWKSDKKIGWDSPWGMGFPGWHIECSAMIRATLGEQIDIHTGGIEHIAIHHNNEIAQSESATGKKPFSRFWMHRAHIQIDGGKIAKSVGNVIYLSTVEEKYHPLALRYLFLGAHYRTNMNFSWSSLEAAQTAFLRLRALVDKYPEGGTPPKQYQSRIHERFNDDLDTAGAIAILWEMTKDDNLNAANIRAGVLDADRVLGLGFNKTDERATRMYGGIFGENVEVDTLPENVRELINRRIAARNNRSWTEADTLRDEIATYGYTIEDATEGMRITKRG